MNFRTTLILVVCLAVFGGLYLGSRGRGGPTVIDPNQDRLISGELVGVRVEMGDRTYELKREADGWAQTAPVWFPLSREAGQRWAWAAQDLRVVETVDLMAASPPSLSTLSLDPPTATVELISGEGAQRFALGDQTVAGPGYLRKEDGTVLLVPPVLHELVYQQTPYAWHAARLPTPPLSNVTTAVLRRDGQTAALHRLRDGWSLDSTRRQRIAPAFLDAFEQLLSQTPVIDTLERRDLNRYGLTSPRATLTLHGAGDEPLELALGRAAAVDEAGVFAELSRGDTPGPVLVLPPAVAELLNAPFDALRDPRLFEAAREDLRLVRIERPGSTAIELVDRGGGLIVSDAESAGAGADSDGIDPVGIADGVLGLHTTQFVTDFSTPVAPAATIRLGWGVTHQVSAQLFRDGDRWVATRDDEPEAYVLDPATVEAMPFELIAQLPPAGEEAPATGAVSPTD